MSRTKLAALALAAVSVAASGCGGSSKTSSSTTAEAAATAAGTTATVSQPPPSAPVRVASGTPLSHATFVAKANAICARTNKKLNTVSVVTTKEFSRVLPQVIVYDHDLLQGLSKLVPPASLASDWGQLLKDLQTYEGYSRTVAQYVQANNLKPAKSIIEKAIETHQHLIAIAARDRLKSCSTEEDAP